MKRWLFSVFICLSQAFVAVFALGVAAITVTSTALAQGNGGNGGNGSGSLPMSAFEALRMLPLETARRIALIEGREGAPVPLRWYLIVYDPAQEHRLAEYVIAGNRLVSARTVSQFAEELSPDDVLQTDVPLLNSDAAFRVVDQFARANNLKVSQYNYELKREGAGSVPLWKITCVDDASNAFASITIAAENGTIVRTEGFNFAPNPRGLSANGSPSLSSDRPVGLSSDRPVGLSSDRPDGLSEPINGSVGRRVADKPSRSPSPPESKLAASRSHAGSDPQREPNERRKKEKEKDKESKKSIAQESHASSKPRTRETTKQAHTTPVAKEAPEKAPIAEAPPPAPEPQKKPGSGILGPFRRFFSR